MRLVDSHAHLQADRFAGDAVEVLAAAREAGVVRLLVPGWDVTSTRAAIEFARTTGVDASAGIHPHHVAEATEATWQEVTELARHPAVVAVGETGLDYDRDFAPRDSQLANLRRHLELALETAKPVILHCRSKPHERVAQDDLLRELAAARVDGPAFRERFGSRPPALLHSVSGAVDYAERALALGLAISISGLCFRRREESTAQVARLVPEDRLLVETDSPYLPAPGAPRRRNEPRYVEITARWVAERRQIDPDALGEQLVATYDRIFGGAASAALGARRTLRDCSRSDAGPRAP
ncbi:MAG: TatD family hydrolase [Chloroflexi bacterium]|nr:TatD family hydrolase [Chloroflexota bacterium]